MPDINALALCLQNPTKDCTPGTPILTTDFREYLEDSFSSISTPIYANRNLYFNIFRERSKRLRSKRARLEEHRAEAGLREVARLDVFSLPPSPGEGPLTATSAI